MEKPLPADLNWTFTLGSICVLIFLVQGVTGMFLALYYNPSPDHAYQAIGYIMKEVSMGRILRGIHHWGASALVVLAFLHMTVNFFYSAFKPPREFTWIIGVCLFLVTLGFGFTGYLLPWDQKAFWATVVSTNIPRDIPLAGRFITRMLLGGEAVSGLTLTRFYALHTLVLPALAFFFILFHLYLVRIHDIAGPNTPGDSKGKCSYLFFPDHLFRCSIAFGIVFAAILLLAVFMDAPLEKAAGTIDPSYLPRPEWYYMWLFQLLTFFPGKTEIIGSLFIPIAGLLILFSIPFLGRAERVGAADRPFAIAAGVAFLVSMVYLTAMGFLGAAPYGESLAVPDRELSVAERQGARIFVERECAYCHQIMGRGGRMLGPDLSNVIAKGRTKDWLMAFIRDPQAASRWTVMPKYDLTEGELDALADFILSLDFDRYHLKTLSREEAVGMRRE